MADSRRSKPGITAELQKKKGLTATAKPLLPSSTGFAGLPLWSELLIVVALTLLVTLPFVFRPFHMDDAGFLELARARQQQPVEMVLSDYTFFGQENEAFLDTHPPLVSTYLTLLIDMAGGESETALHLGFLVFPLIAAVSMYFLARLYARRQALFAALVLIAAPGVMVMSQGLMSDVPGLAFWLAGVALYLYGLKRNSLPLMTACGVAVTLGVFTSYQVLSIIPLLLVYAWLRKDLSLLAFIPFALPVSAFVSFSAWHRIELGVLPRFSYGVGEPLAWYSVVQKGAYIFAALAGAAVFCAALLRALLVRKWDFAVYAAFLVPLWAAVVVQYLDGKLSDAAAVLSILFMPLGVALLYQLFADGWQRLHRSEERRDKLAKQYLLLLWLAGVLFYVAFLMPYSSVRYLLPAFPPVILLFILLVEERFAAARSMRNLLIFGAAATAALGLFVAEADYELALANRDVAQNEAAALGSQAAAAGGRVWFIGEFGFRYYMEQQGFQELPGGRADELRKGDYIVQSPLADPRPLPAGVAGRVELVDRIEYPGTNPIRTINFGADAGFYGHFWGTLPFSLDDGPVEEYLVYRVGKE